MILLPQEQLCTSYELVLDMHSDAIKVSDTKFYFKEGLTLGLDPGYDAGAFNQSSGLSSRLVEQDNGSWYGYQCNACRCYEQCNRSSNDRIKKLGLLLKFK